MAAKILDFVLVFKDIGLTEDELKTYITKGFEVLSIALQVFGGKLSAVEVLALLEPYLED